MMKIAEQEDADHANIQAEDETDDSDNFWTLSEQILHFTSYIFSLEYDSFSENKRHFVFLHLLSNIRIDHE